MHRLGWIAPVTLAVAATTAAAEPIQLGAWFGPRLFSSSRLGFIDDAPAHPELQNAMAFGVRIARPMLPWLVPEFELAMSPTSTNAVGGATSASVFWMEPRLHVRFELWPGHVVEPFVVVGGGAPIDLSTAQKTFRSSITGDGYLGGGVRFDTHKGFVLRFDARVAVLPSQPTSSFAATAELDIGFGLELHFGGPSRAEAAHAGSLADQDGDGVPDAQDACPDRPEDKDGFEDEDGCPDIDNDLDRVLDIADKCPNQPETYNGFEDEDGCPDTVPTEVDALKGTIEGLLYADGETVVRDSARPTIVKIAKILEANPSVRVVLVGHTDDNEAKALAPPDSQLDAEALAHDLSRARAEAVKHALAEAGIAPARLIVDGRGAEEPVAANSTPRGRLANRRVELQLYIPPLR